MTQPNRILIVAALALVVCLVLSGCGPKEQEPVIVEPVAASSAEPSEDESPTDDAGSDAGGHWGEDITYAYGDAVIDDDMRGNYGSGGSGVIVKVAALQRRLAASIVRTARLRENLDLRGQVRVSCPGDVVESRRGDKVRCTAVIGGQPGVGVTVVFTDGAGHISYRLDT